jgi:hypothetical protein
MPIKKLNFSFEVPITALLGLIATGNAGLKIDVVGDDKPAKVPKLLNGAHPDMKLLEGPKRRGSVPGEPRNRGKDEHGNRMTAFSAILKALAHARDHTTTLVALRPIVAGLGLAASSANSQISLLRTRGLARRISEGEYQLTKSGMAEAEKRGLIKAKAKPKTKASNKAAPIAAEGVTEPDHG